MYGLLPILLFSPKNWSLRPRKALLSATLIETPFSVSPFNYKNSLTLSVNHGKMFYPFQKQYLYPCNRTFHLLRSQRLPHRCSPSPQGKRKVSVKAQLKCTWLLASTAQSEAASCIRGRSRALSLRGEGEAIHRITASARLPQKFVSEILLCAPQAPTKTGFQSNFSAFSVTRLRAAIFA